MSLTEDFHASADYDSYEEDRKDHFRYNHWDVIEESSYTYTR